MKAKKLLIYAVMVFAIVLTIKQALAFCDTDFCKEIEATELSKQEKDLLKANSLSSQTYKAGHELVQNLNKEIEFTSPPENVQAMNGIYIKQAWLKIAAVTPSVILGNDLLVPDKFEALSPYHYELEFPQEKSGYCRVEYKNPHVNEKLDLIESDSEVKAELKLDLTVDVFYYQWKSYGKSSKCLLVRQEKETETLTLTDSIKIKRYNKQLEADFLPEDIYHNTLKGKIKSTDSAILNCGNANYKHYHYAYSLVPRLQPYYVLTVKAHQINENVLNNIVQDNETLVLANTKECELTYWDHFEARDKKPNLRIDKHELKIEADKLRYKANETINLELSPKGKELTINYANQSFTARNKAELKAISDFNTIKASLDAQSTETHIVVADKDRFALLYNVSLFSFLNYLLYNVSRKILGGISL